MNTRQLWLAVLVTATLLRLLTLPAYPLHDTTEARYAEIARLMVVSDDWVSPHVAPDTPFWAKPPLSTWAAAASMKLLGANEFAARLPSLLFTLLTVALVVFLGRQLLSANAAIAAGAILLTSVMGFGAAGAVMTDAALAFSTTLSLVAFRFAAERPGSRWSYLFFVGLALGLLAKGPVALVLVGLPILAWSLWQQNIPWLWRVLPWLRGGVLMLAIAAPWYALAEVRTPGFLEYYFVGEHWHRFIDSGWQGDLYGDAHAHTRGTIWLYGLLAALPWSLLALYAGARHVQAGGLRLDPWHAYLLLWMLAPLVFFTFAGNILAAYVLPGLPAFALLLGDYLVKRERQFARLGLIVPALLLGAILSGVMEHAAYRSQKDLLALHYARRPTSALRYFPRLPASASFYSAGRAQAIASPGEIADFLSPGAEHYVALRADRLHRLGDELRRRLCIADELHGYVILQHCAG